MTNWQTPSPSANPAFTPVYARNPWRSIKEEMLVVRGYLHALGVFAHR